MFTSVDFAVVQIIVLSLLAVVGMTIRQLPTFAFRSAGDYESAMADIHARYDGVFGRGIVDAMERLQVFHIFTSTWFTLGLVVLVVSIIVCTLERTPKLWRQAAEVRVAQPEAFYDPALPDRAAMTGVSAGDVREALRRQRFPVREAEIDGIHYLYGDRHRWTKLATLLTHLGLILFLVAGVVTWRFGDEQGLVIAEGDSLTVQPIGTPGLLLVEAKAHEGELDWAGKRLSPSAKLASKDNHARIAGCIKEANTALNEDYKKMAIEAYEAALAYKHARVLDPPETFWSPCEAAADHLLELTGQDRSKLCR